MDNLDWLVTTFGVFSGIAVTVCSFALPVLVIGYILYKRSQKTTAYRRAAQTWLTTTGSILMSSVQSGSSGRSHSVYPVVVYQYEVNGQRYQSQTIKAGEQYLSIRVAGEAQATVNRYPIGTSVTVYYNPSNPSESALER